MRIATSGQVVPTNDWADRLGSDDYWRAKRQGGSSGQGQGSPVGAWVPSAQPRYAPPVGLITTPNPRVLRGRPDSDDSRTRGTAQPTSPGVKRASIRKDDDGEDTASRGGNGGSGGQGSYRTLCVRLCDGFYWPISFATAKDNFARDARTCEKSCGSPARLFTYENPGQQPEDMADLKGRAYKELKVAFLHRSQYNAACTCKPNPWDEAALSRHRAFAETAERRKPGRDRSPAAAVKVAAVAGPAPAGPARLPQPTLVPSATAAPKPAPAPIKDSTGSTAPARGDVVQSPRHRAGAQATAPVQTLFRSGRPARAVLFRKPAQSLRAATGQATATAGAAAPGEDTAGKSPVASAALRSGVASARVR